MKGDNRRALADLACSVLSDFPRLCYSGTLRYCNTPYTIARKDRARRKLYEFLRMRDASERIYVRPFSRNSNVC